MDKEKNNNIILTEPIVKFFRAKNFGFLGTVNKDGSPQVTPTWIDIIENKDSHEGIILVNTATRARKQTSVTKDISQSNFQSEKKSSILYPTIKPK